MDRVEHCVPVGPTTENKLMTLFFSDIMKLYQVFGYNHLDVINKEGLPLIILLMNIIKGKDAIPITFENINAINTLTLLLPKFLVLLLSMEQHYLSFPLPCLHLLVEQRL